MPWLAAKEGLGIFGFADTTATSDGGVAGMRSTAHVICPVIENPTDGGIATDQFLALPLKTDGTRVEPDLLTNFASLRLTGGWANSEPNKPN